MPKTNEPRGKFGPVVTIYCRGEYYDKKDENGETQFIKDLKRKKGENKDAKRTRTRR